MKSVLKTTALTALLLTVATASFAAMPATSKAAMRHTNFDACTKAADEKSGDAAWGKEFKDCFQSKAIRVSVLGKNAKPLSAADEHTNIDACVKAADEKSNDKEWNTAFGSCAHDKNMMVKISMITAKAATGAGAKKTN